MERNVMGELNVYRGSGAKPNFSEIARRHGMDRHTVAKYWREGEAAADGRSARGSAFDPLEEVIRAKAQLPGMTKMAVYAFLREGRGEGLPGYGAFTAWCRGRDVPFGGVGGREPHPRFETPPGRQLQFDWKEGMRLVDSEGEVFEFSVFTATLGYSRKHRFIPVRSRTLDDLLSCLLATFTRLGGVPEECITDNMSCLVTVSGRRRTRQERAWRFAREAGFELRLCALGIEAVRAGREVRFVDCARLVEDLEDASSRGILKKRLKYYAHSRLLIIDELGYLDVGSAGADLLFQLISTRYEQRSTIITTNVGISGWGRVFGDDVAASAIADRVCHHCHLVKITGRSYRLKDLPRDGPVKP